MKNDKLNKNKRVIVIFFLIIIILIETFEMFQLIYNKIYTRDNNKKDKSLYLSLSIYIKVFPPHLSSKITKSINIKYRHIYYLIQCLLFDLDIVGEFTLRLGASSKNFRMLFMTIIFLYLVSHTNNMLSANYKILSMIHFSLFSLL